MDRDSTSETPTIQALKTKLKPPGHFDVSAFFNGVGNGAMVLGFPALLYRMFHEVKGADEIARAKSNKMVLFGTVLGCAVGGIFGLSEARRTREYRSNMAEEIIKLRADLDTTVARTQQPNPTDEKATPSR